MDYGGFWRRLGAFFIDQIILALIITIPPWIAMTPHIGSQAMTLALPVMAMYNILLVTLYGWLCKLKLCMRDGSVITSRAAWLRYCVVVGLHLLANFPKLWNFSLSFLPTSLRYGMPYFASPWSWEEWFTSLAFVWLLSEPFILLLNKERRALQDYIAGTVVIKLQPKDLQETSPIHPHLKASKQPC